MLTFDVAYLRVLQAGMIFLLLLSLLLLYCHGNGLVDEQHHEGESPDPDDRARSRGKTSRSSCPSLNTFVTCYDVVTPILTATEVHFGPTHRRVELPVTMEALGRRFSLRLHKDISAGNADGLKPKLAWSSVISPSAVARLVGEGSGLSLHYAKDGFGIGWFAGHEEFEVAPSSVLASVVDVGGQQLFRAVVHTTSEVYYVEPALDYPQVLRTYSFTNRRTYFSYFIM